MTSGMKAQEALRNITWELLKPQGTGEALVKEEIAVN